jgi:hypothetical protein
VCVCVVSEKVNMSRKSKKENKACPETHKEQMALLDYEYLDTCASLTILKTTEKFTALYDYKPEIKTMEGTMSTIEAMGPAKLILHNECERDKDITIYIANALYSPRIEHNLIAHDDLTVNGINTKITKDGMQLEYKDKVIQRIKKAANRLYRAKFVRDAYPIDESGSEQLMVKYTENVQKNRIASKMWHRRLHANDRKLNRMFNHGIVRGHTPFTFEGEHSPECIECKHKGRRKTERMHSANVALQLPIMGRIIIDLKGPVNPMSHQRERYACNMIDFTSRKSWVIFLKSKAHLYAVMIPWILKSEMIYGHCIRELQFDNAELYLSRKFTEFCAAKGIHILPHASYVHTNTSIVERLIGDLSEKSRVFINQCKLPQSYWRYSYEHASYIHNITPHKFLENKNSPDGTFFGVVPDISALRVFGCAVYVNVAKEKRKNTVADTGIQECIYLGVITATRVLACTKTGRVFNMSLNKCSFDENKFPALTHETKKGTLEFTNVQIDDSWKLTELHTQRVINNVRQYNVLTEMAIDDKETAPVCYTPT